MSAPEVTAHGWLIAFCVTLVVELPLWWLLLRRVGTGRALAIGLLANLLTHPLVWLAWGQLGPWGGSGYWPAVAVTETLVTAAEGAVAHALARPGCGRGECLLVAVLANAASTAVGLVLLPL